MQKQIVYQLLDQRNAAASIMDAIEKGPPILDPTVRSLQTEYYNRLALLEDWILKLLNKLGYGSQDEVEVEYMLLAVATSDCAVNRAEREYSRELAKLQQKDARSAMDAAMKGLLLKAV